LDFGTVADGVVEEDDVIVAEALEVVDLILDVAESVVVY
jgi:hypothetical protein